MIYAKINLPLRFSEPAGRHDRQFQLELIHQGSKKGIKYNDLSSGEKIIAGLANCMYYAESDTNGLSIPKLLLLDEIDAPLHPALTKQLFDVLQEVFIDQLLMKVILSTQAPLHLRQKNPFSTCVLTQSRLYRRLKRLPYQRSLVASRLCFQLLGS